MFERFTGEARAVVSAAVEQAGELGHEGCDDRDINEVLAEFDVLPDDLRKATLRTIGRAA